MSGQYVENFKPAFYKKQIFKKWHMRGFITISYWPHAQKVHVEIGAINPETKDSLGTSEAYMDAHEFASYIHAEVHGTLHIVYPDYHEKKYQSFGGTQNKDSGAITSRVFTSFYWKDTKASKETGQLQWDELKRTFSCQSYEGRKTAQGIFQPIYEKKISVNFVQLTIADIGKLYQSLNQNMIAYAIQECNQVSVFENNIEESQNG
jgi:hypothetical protein